MTTTSTASNTVRDRRAGSRKLIDYTQHRRDDMPSMRNNESTSHDAEPANQKRVNRQQSFLFDSISSLREIHAADTRIEFLFKKVPSCRRRSPELSRDELIRECEKRILKEQHDYPDMLRARRAGGSSIEKGGRVEGYKEAIHSDRKATAATKKTCQILGRR
jgi:hypothetical protein